MHIQTRNPANVLGIRRNRKTREHKPRSPRTSDRLENLSFRSTRFRSVVVPCSRIESYPLHTCVVNVGSPPNRGVETTDFCNHRNQNLNMTYITYIGKDAWIFELGCQMDFLELTKKQWKNSIP